MKSERRHKLQQNALAHRLENLPKMGKESGSKLLLGVVTFLLVIVLIRYYLKTRAEKRELIATELTNARIDLSDLSGDSLLVLGPDARKKTLESIEKKVDAVLAESADPANVAQAKNIRGDAYIQLAAFGNPPEATTQPDLALPRKVDDLLDEAAKTYQEVLDAKEGVPATEMANAHFGLGAIAEDRRDWDKARSQYQAVAGDAIMPKVFTDYAKLRLQVVDKISGPFVIGKPETRPMELTLPPSLFPKTGPTRPTTAPLTAPVSPATVPFGPEAPGTGAVTPGPSTVPTTGPATRGS